MVTQGPSTASGGITAWSRDPSGRRASTIGDERSSRRPSGRDDALDEVDDRPRVEAEHDGFEPPAPLDVGATGTVDHHLGDGRIGEERFERAETGDLVRELLEELVEVRGGEQRLLVAQQLREATANRWSRAGDVEVVGPFGDQPPVDALLELGVRRGRR